MGSFFENMQSDSGVLRAKRVSLFCSQKKLFFTVNQESLQFSCGVRKKRQFKLDILKFCIAFPMKSRLLARE